MWQTFPVTPVEPPAVSILVGVAAYVWSKEHFNPFRATAWARSRKFGTFVVIPLLFATGCRSHQSDFARPVEFTQISSAGSGGLDRITQIGEELTESGSGQQLAVFTHRDNRRMQQVTASRVTEIQPDSRWNNTARLDPNYSVMLVGPQTSISFVIEHAFWQTPRFLASCLLLLGLTAGILYRLRMFRLRNQLTARFQERLAERTRIAQELHDTLLQSFQGLMLRFQAANDTILSDPADAKDTLERALDRADQALAESRKAIQGIRSAPCEGQDLAHSLNSMMNELVKETSFTRELAPVISVLVEGQPKIVNPWIAEEICRIACEALRNAFSHARPKRVEADLAYSERFLRLRFRDDGVGIDPGILKKGGREGHWGITGMNERARSIRGHLNIWSRFGAGTEVELTIPGYVVYERAPSSRWFRGFGGNAYSDYDK